MNHIPTNAEIDRKYRCPHCGQLMPAIRYGARVSARQALIIDIIKTHPGISAAHLAIRLGSKVATVKQHIWQANNVLVETNYRIQGLQTYGYRIIKLSDLEAFREEMRNIARQVAVRAAQRHEMLRKERRRKARLRVVG